MTHGIARAHMYSGMPKKMNINAQPSTISCRFHFHNQTKEGHNMRGLLPGCCLPGVGCCSLAVITQQLLPLSVTVVWVFSALDDWVVVSVVTGAAVTSANTTASGYRCWQSFLNAASCSSHWPK
uniref:Uncharacterized protein n=1 Tax=Anopheles merus TaxID=30066 RepID=A0A182VNW7_ANOME